MEERDRERETQTHPVSPLSLCQDFNPEDFAMMSEDGLDKSQLAGLMTSSSHVPYILSRLNMSLGNKEEESKSWMAC